MSVFGKKKPRIKPQLTLRIFLWALVDVVGMLLLSLGLIHFIYGPGRMFKSFPGTGGEAAVVLAAGAAIMIWAAGNILREMLKQPHLTGDDEAS
ncbi:hypothetical protein [Azospira restricta]|uniref:Uncharacterized protein n=1 Tax=Azospira restricta TaxID=404405 RepID=A0A974Y3K2_9RHOO|nr:hypothetical protein [Azospira restricta]QRJ63861.1 hypothetical protein IWH25_00425 [Azospira restricta]